MPAEPASQVLAQLLSNPGEIVTREELRRAIWAEDTFIEFDTALNVAINKIRQSLRDSASAPLHRDGSKGGYRFLADVHRGGIRTGRPVRPIRRSFRNCRSRRALHWPQLLLAASIVSIAAVWGGSGTRASQSTHQIRSVAVLPFRPLIAEARDEALQVGLAEAIIIRLGQVVAACAVHLRRPALCTTGPGSACRGP